MCQHVLSDVSEIVAVGLSGFDLLDLRGELVDLLRFDVQIALVDGDSQDVLEYLEHRHGALVVHEVSGCLAHQTC